MKVGVSYIVLPAVLWDCVKVGVSYVVLPAVLWDCVKVGVSYIVLPAVLCVVTRVAYFLFFTCLSFFIFRFFLIKVAYQ